MPKLLYWVWDHPYKIKDTPELLVIDCLNCGEPLIYYESEDEPKYCNQTCQREAFLNGPDIAGGFAFERAMWRNMK